MLLLRAVLGHTPDETRCEGCIGNDLAADGQTRASAAFGLELIAQAAAVHHALCQMGAQGNRARAERGLLLGSRRLKLGVRTLPINEPLMVTVVGGQEPMGPGGLIRFEGRVEDAAGGILVSGDATVLEWRPDIQVA